MIDREFGEATAFLLASRKGPINKVSKVGGVPVPSTRRRTCAPTSTPCLSQSVAPPARSFLPIRARAEGDRSRSATTSLVTLIVAQMLLHCPSDRAFLDRAGYRLGHLFPYRPKQPRSNEPCRRLAPKLLVRWKASAAETLGAGADQCRRDT